jgi:toxin CptA
MHNAPLVQYPVGRFAWAVWGCALLGVTAALLTGWLFYEDQLSPAWTLFSGGLVGLVAAVWVRSSRRPSESAWLVWDGQGWQWWLDEDGRRVHHLSTLSVQADFQQVLLLHLALQTRDHRATLQKWVWLYKGFAPEKWHGLRCAVYSRLK